MNRLRSSQGFTLIELVVIILVLGILAVTAIPRFIDLRDEARTASCQGVLGAVRGGIAVIYASNLLNPPEGDGFPTALDNYAGTSTNTSNEFFSLVLDNGIADGGWEKVDGATPTYECLETGTVYTYTPATGSFQ